MNLTMKHCHWIGNTVEYRYNEFLGTSGVSRYKRTPLYPFCIILLKENEKSVLGTANASFRYFK